MAKYSDAIRWMAENDDTDWLGDQDSSPSVTACLTADLFHKDDATVRADLEKYMQQRIGADLRASLTAGDGRPEPLTVGGGAAPIFNLCLFA